MEPESLCFQGLASLYFASMAFFPASLGCDNGILWIIIAAQSLINVCKTLRSSDEVCYVHSVQHIIANKQRLFLIAATTNFWCFFLSQEQPHEDGQEGSCQDSVISLSQLQEQQVFKEQICTKGRGFIWQTLLASRNKFLKTL